MTKLHNNSIIQTSNKIRWMYLAISALAISGFYSIALVILRTPSISSFFSKDIFKTTLVIHVDLSVVVWMLSIISSIWFFNTSNYKGILYKICDDLFYIGVLGVVLIAISPIIATSNPVLNNYIPMLDNWCFILGVVIFGCSILVGAICTIMIQLYAKNDLIKTYNICSAIIVILMFLSFSLSYYGLEKIPYQMDLHFYYEMFFWSGGHIMQFLFVEAIMIVWILLAEKFLNKTLYYQNLYSVLLILNMLLIIPSFYAHFKYSIDSAEFIEYFTSHMKYCGGLAPTFTFIIIMSEYTNSEKSTINNCFIASIMLFFLGGVIGLLISGTNVTIPAHYHGSIVGISIALMGFVYMNLNIDTKASRYQPYVYGMGQIIHISGLAWSGGYGVIRKLPGGEFPIDAKIAMGIMGIGGLIAIIGGLMFVYICARKIYIINKDV